MKITRLRDWLIQYFSRSKVFKVLTEIRKKPYFIDTTREFPSGQAAQVNEKDVAFLLYILGMSYGHTQVSEILKSRNFVSVGNPVIIERITKVVKVPIAMEWGDNTKLPMANFIDYLHYILSIPEKNDVDSIHKIIFMRSLNCIAVQYKDKSGISEERFWGSGPVTNLRESILADNACVITGDFLQSLKIFLSSSKK
ncbi:hypothetical protein [Ekhidna sp.]|uniref:hypothetical protein n=1 Tax=Ekhidna sp. TaxID=2608089 RepID=UPI003BAC0A43